jgi:hypothetical protein
MLRRSLLSQQATATSQLTPELQPHPHQMPARQAEMRRGNSTLELQILQMFPELPEFPVGTSPQSLGSWRFRNRLATVGMLFLVPDAPTTPVPDHSKLPELPQAL